MNNLQKKCVTRPYTECFLIKLNKTKDEQVSEAKLLELWNEN